MFAIAGLRSSIQAVRFEPGSLIHLLADLSASGNGGVKCPGKENDIDQMMMKLAPFGRASAELR